MNSYNFCTYFDHNYLPRAIVMLESLFMHCPDACVYVLCLTEQCQRTMQKLDYPNVKLISLSELEMEDKDLVSIKETRNIVEYFFTLTPCLPYFLLQKYTLDSITYLDADMIFFSSPKSIFDEAKDASIIITPHRFSQNIKYLEKYGIYNVSWLSFKNDEHGIKCLEWYRKSCLDWCYDILEDDRYADQKYLDFFSAKFQNVHAIMHHGAGLAPWNILDTHFSYEQNTFKVNNVPLIFLHAQGFKHIWGPVYDTGFEMYSLKLTNEIAKKIYRIYTKKQIAAEKKARQLLGETKFQSQRTKQLNTAQEIIKKIIGGIMKKTIIIRT